MMFLADAERRSRRGLEDKALRTLEETIRPARTSQRQQRDLLGALLAVALTASLLWGRAIDEQRYYSDIVGQMFSFYLLPALGFLLALREGAIDLSVWAVAALGGAVAAWLIGWGVPPTTAILAAGACGLVVGLFHGLVVSRLRVPAPLLTLVTAGAIVLGLRAAFPGGSVRVPADSFDGWMRFLSVAVFGGEQQLVLSHPFLLRVLMVLGGYVAIWAIMTIAQAVGGRLTGSRSRWLLVAALCASGLLAGLSGPIWLIENDCSPIPHRLIGDLRIPAAALLAGAALFRGPPVDAAIGGLPASHPAGGHPVAARYGVCASRWLLAATAAADGDDTRDAPGDHPRRFNPPQAHRAGRHGGRPGGGGHGAGGRAAARCTRRSCNKSPACWAWGPGRRAGWCRWFRAPSAAPPSGERRRRRLLAAR